MVERAPIDGDAPVSVAAQRGLVGATVRRRVQRAAQRLHESPVGPFARAAASRVMTPSWNRRGRPAPAPPHVKRSIVAGYASRSHIDTFIETGTYRGDTVAVLRSHVARSYSIELDPRLASMARRRFRRHTDVTIIEGDSGSMLPALVATLDAPALFWLDGHYSDGVTALGDRVTPIESELATVLSPGNPAHVVLIDDARLFTGDGGYPALAHIEHTVRRLRPSWSFEVRDDIIRIEPASAL